MLREKFYFMFDYAVSAELLSNFGAGWGLCLFHITWGILFWNKKPDFTFAGESEKWMMFAAILWLIVMKSPAITSLRHMHSYANLSHMYKVLEEWL